MPRLTSICLNGVPLDGEDLCDVIRVAPNLTSLHVALNPSSGFLSSGYGRERGLGLGGLGLPSSASPSLLSSVDDFRPARDATDDQNDQTHQSQSLRWLAHLGSLSKLRKLSLRGCTIDVNTTMRLAHLPLEVLALCACGLTDDALAPLSRVRTLKQLALCYNSITDAGVEHICRLPSLVNLSMRGNENIRNNGACSLAVMPRLRCIDLSGCFQITHVGLHAFILREQRGLPRMTIVRWNGSAYDRTIFTRFALAGIATLAERIHSKAFERADPDAAELADEIVCPQIPEQWQSGQDKPWHSCALAHEDSQQDWHLPRWDPRGR